MRLLLGFGLIAALLCATFGCGNYGPKPFYEGPKVESFSGRVVQDGKQVTFSKDNEVVIDFYSEGGIRFGVPIKADGTFNIGYMPLGKQSLVLERGNAKYSIPGGLTIEAGKTSGYEIELGKGYKRDQKAPDEGPKINKYKG